MGAAFPLLPLVEEASCSDTNGGIPRRTARTSIDGLLLYRSTSMKGISPEVGQRLELGALREGLPEQVGTDSSCVVEPL